MLVILNPVEHFKIAFDEFCSSQNIRWILHNIFKSILGFFLGSCWWTRTLHWPCLHCCFYWTPVLYIDLHIRVGLILIHSPKVWLCSYFGCGTQTVPLNHWPVISTLVVYLYSKKWTNILKKYFWLDCINHKSDLVNSTLVDIKSKLNPARPLA